MHSNAVVTLINVIATGIGVYMNNRLFGVYVQTHSISYIAIIVLLLLAFSMVGCDPLIIVRGHAGQELAGTTLEGRVASIDKRGISDVQVFLRSKDNPQRGFRGATNEYGDYEISGIITAIKTGWNWSGDWEILFEKGGYESIVIDIDPKKHKDSEGDMKWQYRVDVVLVPKGRHH